MTFAFVDSYFLVNDIDQISTLTRDTVFPFCDNSKKICSKLVESSNSLNLGNLNHTIAYVNSTDMLSSFWEFRDYDDLA